MIGPGDLEDPPAAARLIDFDGMLHAGSPTARIDHTHTPRRGHTWPEEERMDIARDRDRQGQMCGTHTRDDAQHGKKMWETARRGHPEGGLDAKRGAWHTADAAKQHHAAEQHWVGRRRESATRAGNFGANVQRKSPLRLEA